MITVAPARFFGLRPQNDMACHPEEWNDEGSLPCGASRVPAPTNQKVLQFVSTLKRFCHAEMGEKLFQRGYYDHVIRDEDDYWKIVHYINNNPARWAQDRFYVE